MGHQCLDEHFSTIKLISEHEPQLTCNNCDRFRFSHLLDHYACYEDEDMNFSILASSPRSGHCFCSTVCHKIFHGSVKNIVTSLSCDIFQSDANYIMHQLSCDILKLSQSLYWKFYFNIVGGQYAKKPP